MQAPSPVEKDAQAHPKMRWVLKNTKWLVATLAVPLVLAWLGHQYTVTQDNRAAEERTASDVRALKESRLKAYSELLNKREESELGVRSQVFSTLLGNYLNPMKGDLAHRMTVLELLATNFNETLDLSPLFWQLDRELAADGKRQHGDLREQLSRLATDLKEHQMDVLSASSSASTTWDISLNDASSDATLPERLVQFNEPGLHRPALQVACKFQVSILDRDAIRRRIYVVVSADAPASPSTAESPCVTNSQPPAPKQWSFWVDEFDFPLINYTRVSDTERFALVLLRYKEEERSVQLGLVFFPSSRGSARDRPYLDTVIDSLNAPIETKPISTAR